MLVRYWRSSSPQILLSKTKQRCLKKAEGWWNRRSLLRPSLPLCDGCTRLSELVSLFNEASVVGNLQTNTSINRWFKPKVFFGWRCDKLLWEFLLLNTKVSKVAPPFISRETSADCSSCALLPMSSSALNETSRVLTEETTVRLRRGWCLSLIDEPADWSTSTSFYTSYTLKAPPHSGLKNCRRIAAKWW